MLLDGDLTGHLWNKLFRRELTREIEFTPARVHSDLAMVAQLFAAADRVAGYARRSRHRGNAPIPSTLRLGGGKGPPPALIKVRRESRKAAADGAQIDHRRRLQNRSVTGESPSGETSPPLLLCPDEP